MKNTKEKLVVGTLSLAFVTVVMLTYYLNPKNWKNERLQ